MFFLFYYIFVKLKKNTHVELPLWAAVQFATSSYFVSYMPEKYSRAQREHIYADPTNITLFDSPYFYEVGKQISSLPSLANDNLLPFLFLVWSVRYQQILLTAHNYDSKSDDALVSRMSLMEKDSLIFFTFSL